MFHSHLDGSKHMLSPERSIEIQCLLGSDIQMQLDECIELPADAQGSRARDGAVAALGGALAMRSRCERGAAPGQALFGIVQGGDRSRAATAFGAKALVGMDLAGYAVGGLAVGEGHDRDACARSRRRLPLLSAGQAALPDGRRYAARSASKRCARGVDMFDCVLPTRNGRHGLALYVASGP